MALTRARPVAGPPDLQDEVGGIIRNVLAMPRDPDRVLFTVADMRRRLAEQYATENPWSVKHVRGGLLDLEFIAQYLQLRHGTETPSVFSPRTLTAYENIRSAGLIREALASELTEACVLMDAIRGFSRQAFGGDFDPAQHVSRAQRAALTRAAGFESFEALEEAVLEHEARVKAVFDEMIAEPASRLDTSEEQQNDKNS
jgi:glutamate-ammonia-ligase adenylyltransferase